MTKEQLIEKYELENKNILNRRPDLNMNGDFTPDGIKVFCNTGFIADIQALNIPVVVNCGEITISNQEYENLKRDSDNLNKVSFSM